MNHREDLRELVEALICIAHNPVAQSLAELGRAKDGMRVSEFISGYAGLKDGEFLGVLSTLFGLSFAAGKARCDTGIGSALNGLLSDVFAVLTDTSSRRELMEYLGVREIDPPEVSYWKDRLTMLDTPEVLIIKVLAGLDANGEGKGKSLDEISDGARSMEPDAEVSPADLARLTSKMPVVKDGPMYYLSVEPWHAFQEALAAMETAVARPSETGQD